MKRPPEIGDYVLATEDSKGDARYGWCVGHLAKVNIGKRSKGYAVEADGKSLLYYRAEKISSERGKFILDNSDFICRSVRSLWWWKRCNIQKTQADINYIKNGSTKE